MTMIKAGKVITKLYLRVLIKIVEPNVMSMNPKLNIDEVVDLSTAIVIISDVVVVNISGNPRKIMDVAKKNMIGLVGLYAEK